MPSYQTMNSKYPTSSSPAVTEEAGRRSVTDSVSSIAAEDFQFLPQSRRRHDRSLKAILHRRLVRLWLYAVSGALAIVSIIFVFTFVVQPRASVSMTSRNFISNNPIETNGKPIDGVSKWLNDFSYSAIPVMCHSHNDYTRPYPLFSALAAGCASVEADVWSTPDGKDLLVGHNKRSLSTEKTLQSLYINPLLEILDTMNPPDAWNNFSRIDQADGVFRTLPDKTLILFIDVKDDPSRTWPLVLKQLEPLREKLYLSRHERILDDNGTPVDKTFWSGPITVVGTGNILDARFVNYGSNTTSWRNYHDAFLDAYLDQITAYDIHGKGVDTIDPWLDNEFYTASVSFWKTIGSVRTGLSKHQLSKLRDQINSAQMKGLTARYWGLPDWPISHRDYVWRVLIREGIDLLNADDVQSAAKRDWSYGYARETVWISIVSAYILAVSVLLLWVGHRTIQNEAKRARNSY